MTMHVAMVTSNGMAEACFHALKCFVHKIVHHESSLNTISSITMVTYYSNQVAVACLSERLVHSNVHHQSFLGLFPVPPP